MFNQNLMMETDMTRTLIAFTLAAVTVAGAAAAQPTTSYFAIEDHITRNNIVDLGNVTAEADGVVEVYDINGNFLGSTEVRQGANTDVRVNLGHPPVTDVRAELKIDGTVVASQDYDWAR